MSYCTASTQTWRTLQRTCVSPPDLLSNFRIYLKRNADAHMFATPADSETYFFLQSSKLRYMLQRRDVGSTVNHYRVQRLQRPTAV
jgi:hypothetical protein